MLKAAGIGNASGLVSALSSDAENLLVVFTAKRLNSSIRVISKAVEEESEQKLRMAGADSVVMPNFIGGLRMASELIRPSVVNFLDVMLRSRDRTIRVEEMEISGGSGFCEKTLQETGIPEMRSLTVVAIKRPATDGYEFNPPADTVLAAGDILILIGETSEINRLKRPADALQ
jgi:voltage-gated potassium channel